MKLELIGINKYFDEFHVLNDINITIQSGEIFGYLGRNGA
ncbi:MAG: ABC transporter ATP-binding protein, partial [Bacteroidales bacterium]|nr:ABC transporter ATP-binding protein [Bacteroidales bacterium]